MIYSPIFPKILENSGDSRIEINQKFNIFSGFQENIVKKYVFERVVKMSDSINEISERQLEKIESDVFANLHRFESSETFKYANSRLELVKSRKNGESKS